MVEKHLTPDEKLQQEFNRWAAAGRGAAYLILSSGSGGRFGALRRNSISRSPNLFRHRRRNPLIQGDAVFLRQTLRRLLDRERQFQRVSCFAHRFTITSYRIL
jgi:hypothetical protein